MSIEAEALRDLVLDWQLDPGSAVHDLFRVDPDPWQEEVLQAVMDGEDVSVRSCHGPGKTATVAWAIYLFMLTRFPVRIPCTAPAGPTLHDVLWPELYKWRQEMPPYIRARFSLGSDRLAWADAPRESFAVARTARPENPEALQGFHADHVLYVIDEASGVPEAVYETAEGAMTSPGAQKLMTSNPTRSSGYFHASHHKMRDLYHTIKVSAGDSPRVSDEYCERMARMYGRTSNVYRVRVLGEFPKSEDDVVIPLDMLEAAKRREVYQLNVQPVWGVDPGFTGDESALARRRGNIVTHTVKTWHGLDPMQLAGQIRTLYDECLPHEVPESINVDVIGLGLGVYARLRELGLPAKAVNVSERAASSDRYFKLRDELWFLGRDWFDSQNCSIPDDEELIGELSIVKYHPPNSNGQLKVFSKEEMRKPPMSAKSPNRADAFLLTLDGRDKADEAMVSPTARRALKRKRGNPALRRVA